MPRPEPTEIHIAEDGEESHPSWLLIRFNNVSSKPGARLFDSEIQHQHYVQMTVTRCTRKRDLNHDWIHPTEELIEVNLSQAQFGAAVSSFGDGSGVPATLSHWQGQMVPGVATNDSRLNESHKEVRNAANKGMEEVRKAHKALQEAFDQNLGKKVLRDRLRNLEIVMGNLPSNLQFAAESLTEHTEKVTTKMRSDIEAMVLNAQQHGTALDSGSSPFGDMTIPGPGYVRNVLDTPTDEQVANGEEYGSRRRPPYLPACVAEHGEGHETCPKCWTRS